MRQGIQRDLKDAEVNEYGCYALCIIQWAEIETYKTFSETEVLGIIKKARASGLIGSECFVINPPALFNLAAGKNLKTQCVKTTVPGKPTSICCNKKPMYTHFTLWTDGKTWDPLPPNRSSAKAYKPDSWRVLS
jgi:hypothetical protein